MALVLDQLRILGMMAAHEAAVGDLYRAYAEVFPRRREFFLQIAAQEGEHARAIAGLVDRVRAGRGHVPQGRFPSESVLASLDQVEERTRDATRKRFSLAEALAAALELEEGMLEQRCFEVVEGDSPELVEVLRKLETDTREHREAIREALRGERGLTE